MINCCILQQGMTDLLTYGIGNDICRPRLRKIHPYASSDEIIDYRVINGEHGCVSTVVNAKFEISTEMATCSAGQFPLDANYTDGRATPLRSRREVEQVTQELLSSWPRSV